MTLLKVAGTSEIPAVGGLHDNMQMDDNGLVAYVCHMPLVRVFDMSPQDALHVDLRLLFLRTHGGRNDKQQEQQEQMSEIFHIGRLL
jgi:hypothetical protein